MILFLFTVKNCLLSVSTAYVVVSSQKALQNCMHVKPGHKYKNRQAKKFAFEENAEFDLNGQKNK